MKVSLRLVAVGLVLVASACMTQSRTVVSKRCSGEDVRQSAADNSTVSDTTVGGVTEDNDTGNLQKANSKSRDTKVEATVEQSEGLQDDSDEAQRSGSTLLYPFGDNEGDARHPQVANDACSVKYEEDIVVFGETKSEIYVCVNGLLSLDQEVKLFASDPFPLDSGVGIIAPFWADATLTLGGRLFHRKTTDAALLAHVSNRVIAAYGFFIADWLIITTWYEVRAFGSEENSPERNTFQCVLAVSGQETYVLFLYDTILWTIATASSSIPAQVGFDSGDGVNFYSVAGSQTAEIVNITQQTNIGEPGVLIYKLSDLEIQPPPKTSCEENGNTYRIVPGTDCTKFTQGTESLPAVIHTCSPGTAFDLELCVCNWPHDFTC